jgi:hypothetical protein
MQPGITVPYKFDSAYKTFLFKKGFALNLRTIFIYDIIGLEWSDDSLFFVMAVSQALGASFGLPIAGKIKHTIQASLAVF